MLQIRSIVSPDCFSELKIFIKMTFAILGNTSAQTLLWIRSFLDSETFSLVDVGSNAPMAEQELLREVILSLSGASGSLVQYDPTFDAFIVS